MSDEFKQMRNVAIFGTTGGLLAWLASLRITPTAELHWYLALISMALGAGAGLIFVFVIANTDRTDRPRLWTLALLAGFFWEPVWEGARAFVVSQFEKEAIARAENALERAADLAVEAANTRSADERRELMRELKGAISRAAAHTEAIQTLAGLTQVEAAAGELAASLQELAPQERREAAEHWERSFHGPSDAPRSRLLLPDPEPDEPP